MFSVWYEICFDQIWSIFCLCKHWNQGAWNNLLPIREAMLEGTSIFNNNRRENKKKKNSISVYLPAFLQANVKATTTHGTRISDVWNINSIWNELLHLLWNVLSWYSLLLIFDFLRFINTSYDNILHSEFMIKWVLFHYWKHVLFYTGKNLFFITALTECDGWKGILLCLRQIQNY